MSAKIKPAHWNYVESVNRFKEDWHLNNTECDVHEQHGASVCLFRPSLISLSKVMQFLVQRFYMSFVKKENPRRSMFNDAIATL